MKEAYRFGSRFQPIQNIERTAAPLLIYRINTFIGHGGDHIVSDQSGMPSGSLRIAHCKDQDTCFRESRLNLRRITAIESTPQSPDNWMACVQQQLGHLFFEWRMETAHHDPIGGATLFGPLESLFSNGRRNNARGEEGDRRTVEQSVIALVIVIESHKNVGCRIDLPHTQAFAAPTEISNTDSPRETSIAQNRPKPIVQYIRPRSVLLHLS